MNHSLFLGVSHAGLGRGSLPDHGRRSTALWTLSGHLRGIQTASGKRIQINMLTRFFQAYQWFGDVKLVKLLGLSYNTYLHPRLRPPSNPHAGPMLRLDIILYMELRPWGNDCASALSKDKGKSFACLAAATVVMLLKPSREGTGPVPCPCSRES